MRERLESLTVFLFLLAAAGTGCDGRAQPVYWDAGRDGQRDSEASVAQANADVAAAETGEVGRPTTESADAVTPVVDAAVDSPLPSSDVADAAAAAGTSDARDTASGAAALGKACQRASDCASNHCQEGVCCDAGCAGTCQSCLNTNTGKPDGTCAPVKAGLAHGSDCTAADSTTCGLDGKCDGAGACRYFPMGTSCASEACTDGAELSSYSSTRTCDGKGACRPASTSTCASAYRCNGNTCRTSCVKAQDCVPASYCAGNTCLPKKADGQPCSAASECRMGVCGGVCCAAGCTCTLQNSANLLKNGGFDKNISDWSIEQGSLSRSAFDVESCPYSGSLSTTLAPGTLATISQCVSNTPLSGRFTFGGRIQIVGVNGLMAAGAGALCIVRFHVGFNCDSTEVVDGETASILGQDNIFWQDMAHQAEDETPVSGANSVLFSCLVGAGPDAAARFSFDQLYVSRAPARF